MQQARLELLGKYLVFNCILQVRLCYDLMEDFYSPRSAASDCLSTLCKVRAKPCHCSDPVPCSPTLLFCFVLFCFVLLCFCFALFRFVVSYMLSGAPQNLPSSRSVFLWQRHAGSCSHP